MNRTIGIIGGGFVGAILKKYYPSATMYDIDESIRQDELEDVLNKEIIFIAFNLKDNASLGTADIEFYLDKMQPGTLVVIKSTFKIGTTDILQEKYPNIDVVYNCEFLTEATAWEDFTRPQFQILGCPNKALHRADELFNILPGATTKRIISPLDAEFLKHATNSFYGLKVIWFNQLYDASRDLNVDYETVREIMVQNPWIGNSHSSIWHRGYRGYGTPETSKCIPKDLRCFLETAKLPLLQITSELNEKYTKELREMPKKQGVLS